MARKCSAALSPDNEADFKQNAMYVKSNSAIGLLEMTVLATAAAGLLYFGYFQLAPWIWNQSLPINPDEVMIWYVPYLELRDGIELYALYALMFLNLLLVYALSCGWNRLTDIPVRYLIILPLAVVACAFIGSIGFYPPMSTLADQTAPDIFARSLMVMAVILPIITLLYYLQKRSAPWTLAIAAFLLLPVCFISTQSISWFDYEFIFAPALRLFHGANISEAYLPYDLMLSLIALAWMKLQLDLNLFQVVAQCAYYLLLLGIFAFSRQWLMDKRLPVLLLVTLVLVRIYAGPYDAVYFLQVTPLRLDMWLILLLLVYFKGPHHWSAGLFCGLMLLLHKNFGVIYSAAYIQLLLTLCVINTAIFPGRAIKTVSTAAVAFFRKNYPNLVLILMGALAHYLLFMNTNDQIDFDLIRLGLSFIKITTNSFYWYVVVVLGLSFAFLLKLRSRISSNYLATGFCLIYLAIGNSLYFFGGSRENAIIALSAILLPLFFLLLDLAGHALANGSGKPVKSFIHRNLAIIVSLTFIASITIWYGDSITVKATTQAHNAGKGQFIYPPEVSESKQYLMRVIAEVKSVTGDNPKVYFVDANDFLLDYYGNYAPVGYYNPVYSWISKRAFNKFLQGLMDQGYYLVINNTLVEYMPLPFKSYNYKMIRRRLVVWK